MATDYDKIFADFEKTNGKFALTWNWWALLCGPFWYLATGLWGKALVYFFASSVLVSVTGGAATPFVWAAYGALANYDYFLLMKRQTQFWEGVKGSGQPFFTPPAASFGFSNVSHTRPGEFEQRFKLLQETHQHGLLTDEEYQRKRQGLLLEMEHQEALDKLAQARVAGIVTAGEYEAKRAAVLAGPISRKSCPGCHKHTNKADAFCTGCGHQYSTNFR